MPETPLHTFFSTSGFLGPRVIRIRVGKLSLGCTHGIVSFSSQKWSDHFLKFLGSHSAHSEYCNLDYKVRRINPPLRIYMFSYPCRNYSIIDMSCRIIFVGLFFCGEVPLRPPFSLSTSLSHSFCMLLTLCAVLFMSVSLSANSVFPTSSSLFNTL